MSKSNSIRTKIAKGSYAIATSIASFATLALAMYLLFDEETLGYAIGIGIVSSIPELISGALYYSNCLGNNHIQDDDKSSRLSKLLKFGLFQLLSFFFLLLYSTRTFTETVLTYTGAKTFLTSFLNKKDLPLMQLNLKELGAMGVFSAWVNLFVLSNEATGSLEQIDDAILKTNSVPFFLPPMSPRKISTFIRHSGIALILIEFFWALISYLPPVDLRTLYDEEPAWFYFIAGLGILISIPMLLSVFGKLVYFENRTSIRVFEEIRGYPCTLTKQEPLLTSQLIYQPAFYNKHFLRLLGFLVASLNPPTSSGQQSLGFFLAVKKILARRDWAYWLTIAIIAALTIGTYITQSKPAAEAILTDIERIKDRELLLGRSHSRSRWQEPEEETMCEGGIVRLLRKFVFRKSGERIPANHFIHSYNDQWNKRSVRSSSSDSIETNWRSIENSI